MQPAPTNPSAGGLSPGSLLRRKYRIVRVLGQGGMGTVLEAVHIDLDRRVAIKVLHPELLDKTDLVERFVREGRAASRIEGDHVARVFDVDRLDDDTPFLVMEYLDGQDLSYVRHTRAPLPVREAIDYVLQACTAVAQAHAAGVIHRDIKPANLFLAAAPDGTRRIKVLDFGISKITGPLGASEPSMTRTTLIMGSVEYMSPEQMLSTRNVDVRTDIWALGVVLFELLTSAPPFTGETPTQVCAHVMSQPAIHPRSLRSDIPEAVEAIVLRCLEKDRERRFANVEELSRALRTVIVHPSAPPEVFAPAAAQCVPEPPPPQPTTLLTSPASLDSNGTPSWHSSQTSGGVASDPSPGARAPSGAGPWLAAIATGAGLLALLGWLLWPATGNEQSASSAATLSATTAAGERPDATATAMATEDVLPVIEPAPSSITSTPTETPVAQSSTSSALSVRSGKTPKPPGANKGNAKLNQPKPTKTSGID